MQILKNFIIARQKKKVMTAVQPITRILNSMQNFKQRKIVKRKKTRSVPRRPLKKKPTKVVTATTVGKSLKPSKVFNKGKTL